MLGDLLRETGRVFPLVHRHGKIVFCVQTSSLFFLTPSVKGKVPKRKVRSGLMYEKRLTAVTDVGNRGGGGSALSPPLPPPSQCKPNVGLSRPIPPRSRLQTRNIITSEMCVTTSTVMHPSVPYKFQLRPV